ncbi:unnamed protein product [Cunninghamella echinulata]
MPIPLSLDDINESATITHHIKPIIDNKAPPPPPPIITSAINITLNYPNPNSNNNHLYKPLINKIEPSIRSIYSPLDRSNYRLSAIDMIRQHYQPQDLLLQQSIHTLDDDYSTSSSSSSFESSNSSISTINDTLPLITDTTATATTNTITTSISSSDKSSKKSNKKKSYRRLLREIRRLRSENDQLHSSVNMLKEDLRNEKESRFIADQCHKKFFDDSMDKHTQLELEILDQKDLILSLQSRLNDTLFTSSPNNNNNSNNNSSSSGNEEEIIDCSLWNFEDIDCTYEQHQQQHYDSTVEQIKTEEKDQGVVSHLMGNDNQSKEEYDEEDDDDDQQEQFEVLAESYLRQALISNLTSARTNLELDDLILKYDPSPERILKTLADTFLGWICDTIHNTSANTTASLLPSLPSSSCISSCTSSLCPSTSTTATTTTTTTSMDHHETPTTISINKLFTTEIQSIFLRFWKNVFEQHVHNDLDQYQFLQQVEKKLTLHLQQQDHDQYQNEFQSIIHHFQTLLIMLYKHDILEGEAITLWWHTNDQQQQNNTDVGNQLRNTTRKFVEWVDETEEDEDDDDNDIEDDEDDDEDDDDEDDEDNEDDDNLIQNENDIIHYNDYTTAVIPTINITSPQQVSEKKKKSVTIQV